MLYWGFEDFLSYLSLSKEYLNLTQLTADMKKVHDTLKRRKKLKRKGKQWWGLLS